MNNLEQFTEERIIEIRDLYDQGARPSDSELKLLCNTTLAAKRGEPLGYLENGKGFMYEPRNKDRISNPVPVYLHPQKGIPGDVRDALEKALNAMQFMGDTLNNLDVVCAEDVEHVTPAFEAIRKLLASAPNPE